METHPPHNPEIQENDENLKWTAGGVMEGNNQ